jgi:CheY-like chemotaxis protein
MTKIFTPFERLGASASTVEGTGLGLTLSQRMATAMGGALTVESTLGQGSTFSIELAQATLSVVPAPNSPESTQQHDPNRQPGRRYSVLCIEDNPSNLHLMEAIFESRPEITLLTAIQGGMGLDVARQHEPDLILLDLNLPDIHGKEVLVRLQQSSLTRDIPVVIVSADATPVQIERLLAAGAGYYLTKPINVEQFLRTVDELLPVTRPLPVPSF